MSQEDVTEETVLLPKRDPIYILTQGRPAFRHDWDEVAGLTPDELSIAAGIADNFGIWRDTAAWDWTPPRFDPPFAKLIVSWYETGAYRDPSLPLAKFLALVFAEVSPPPPRLTLAR